jgi:hypothetical protein
MTASNGDLQGRDDLIPFTLHLSPDQIEWLSDRADQNDTTVGCMVRTLFRTIRARGDVDPANLNGSSGASSRCDSDATTLDRLRRANERLESITASDEADSGETDVDEEVLRSSPLADVESPSGPAPAEDREKSGDPPSMFDLAE